MILWSLGCFCYSVQFWPFHQGQTNSNSLWQLKMADPLFVWSILMPNSSNDLSTIGFQVTKKVPKYLGQGVSNQQTPNSILPYQYHFCGFFGAFKVLLLRAKAFTMSYYKLLLLQILQSWFFSIMAVLSMSGALTSLKFGHPVQWPSFLFWHGMAGLLTALCGKSIGQIFTERKESAFLMYCITAIFRLN